MSPPAVEGRRRVEVGAAVRPLVGEVESGDAIACVPWARGVIVALVDGLGHGPRAAAAAAAFVECVGDGGALPLEELFARAHRALMKTRGAVASVARFDEERGSVEIAGIGNISTLLVRTEGQRTEHALVHPGILGSAYRAVRPQTFPFDVGDVLLMHSDGIRSRFDLALLRVLPVKAAADAILRVNAKGSDDAACVVARGVVDATSSLSTTDARHGEGDRAIPLRIPGDAECAAHEARCFARASGLGAREQWEVSIVASELATNVLKYAGEGVLHLKYVATPRATLIVEAVDRGRGIDDIASAIADGFTERPSKGLGVGLGCVHRLMDHVEIESNAVRGTRIVARKFRESSPEALRGARAARGRG